MSPLQIQCSIGVRFGDASLNFRLVQTQRQGLFTAVTLHIREYFKLEMNGGANYERP